MNTLFTKMKGSLLTAAALGALASSPAFAQLNYRPNTPTNTTNAVNTTGTYTDLGTNGTAITVTDNDNSNSAPQPIGFTFNYNGQAFTQFTLNTNGFITLGSTPAAAATLNWIAATANNIIAPGGGVDLQGAADQVANPTEFRVHTTGAAGSQVTTIQWENLSDKATPTASANAQFTRINFQLKLYEGTNVIEFIYGTWVSNGAVPTSGQPFMIGLKGSSSAPIDRLLGHKPSSATPWTATTFSQVEGGFVPSHFIRNTFLPDPGRTYRFTPIVIPANDLAVTALFVQGKMARNYGSGDTIMAVVKNSGSATQTRAVSLTVSGANTYSSSVTVTLAPGEDTLVSFLPAFMPTVFTPSNFVEATLPNDDDNSNNVKDANITVTQNTIGYSQYPTTVNGAPTIVTALRAPYPVTGGTPATRNANFLVRFHTTQAINITKVRAYIPGAAFNPAVNTTGITVYGVVFDANGIEIGRSADKVIAAADVDKLVEFTLTSPAPVNNETYYIGMAVPPQPQLTADTYAMATQEEGDIRLNTYYVSAVNSTTTLPPLDFEDDYRFVLEADFTTTVGIKESLNAKLVSVYPNPSNGTFHVSAKAMKGNHATMEVRDMQGKVVYIEKASKEEATLNLKNLSSGVYMLRVATDQEVAVKRLVIK